MPATWGPNLLVAAVLLPLFGALGSFLAPRFARSLTVVLAGALLVDVAMLAVVLGDHGPLRYHIGGWGAPLGIDLYLDGLAMFMLLATTLTGTAITAYGARYFSPGPTHPGGFWPLWLLLWTAMNALFLSADLFNLYVTLELMGLAAVALVALAGGADAITGAMRYLLMTMLASLTYLLGVALLYHQAGALDMALLGATLQPTPAVWLALALMVAALLMKSAMFPLHFWLPPAHASAPAPVSAVLSGLVIKATVYLLARLWFQVVPGDKAMLGQGLACLGAAAIVWGSVQALRQQELKLLVAYSTVAQVGYLFLPFAVRAADLAAMAWRGALYFLLCHALAKAAMFMAVGNVMKLGGGGRIDELHHVATRLPMTLAAFGIAGVNIIGLPPSGGFLAKWLLLQATVTAGLWWVTAVVLAGGLLSAAYVFKVVGFAFTDQAVAGERRGAPHLMEWVALLLALTTLVLGFTAPLLLELLEVGAPFAAATGGMEEGP